jgi:hypothetical protein
VPAIRQIELTTARLLDVFGLDYKMEIGAGEPMR